MNFGVQPPGFDWGDTIHENEEVDDVEEGIEVVDDPEADNNMGKEEFLKLLATQLQNQDPMDPMDNKEFMGEMAKFNSLQQMQSLNNTMEQFVDYQNLTRASSLVGKEAKVLNSETGESVTGRIDSVEMTGSEPKAVIAGEKYDLGQIQEVLAGE